MQATTGLHIITPKGECLTCQCNTLHLLRRQRYTNFVYMKNNGERINQIISHFCESKADFARKVGEAPQTVSNWVARDNGKAVLNKIAQCFPEVNYDWLETGHGSMLGEQESEGIEMPKSNGLTIDSIEKYEKAKELGLPLLPETDFKFAGGQTQLVRNTEDITRYWYLPDCNDCEGVAQIIGRSMSPTLPSGSWVALKKYTIPTDNPNMIPFGNIFGIVVEDEDTGEYHGHIKILRRYKDKEMSSKYWIAHSINEEEFDDFDIKIAQVRALWIVKQHIVSDIL